MEKSTHSPLYDAFCARLLEMRMAAGLTQRKLASRLGREPSFIWRIEHGERRLDVVEFVRHAKACGVPEAAWKIPRELVAIEEARSMRARRRSRPRRRAHLI